MKIIGISGVSRSGKDTFANILTDLIIKDGKKVRTESFAAPLREELDPILKYNFDLNVYSQNSAQKTVFRDLMVAWAKIRRHQTNGQYFVDKLKERINKYKYKEYDYLLIPDLRFGEFFVPEIGAGDEIGFIKENNGIIVHISQPDLGPANSTEEFNDPIVKNHANITIKWPFINSCDYNVLKKNLEPQVEWMYKNYEQNN